jgi:hypothetical protein
MLVTSTSAMAKKPIVTDETVVWDLKNVEVISPGLVIEMEEGTLIKGITIEARAKAKGVNQVPEGKFRLTMDAFWPDKDMPTQDAGFWYIQGNWSISKKDASAASLKSRHSPDVIKGHIKAQLTFNPMASSQPWSALATVPMSPALGRWSRGQGSLSLISSTAGSLYLDLSRSLEVR